ncbi:MAG: histidine phosphatase family protein [Acidimicrobiales bacterium]|nr:histidine phosphatase family protein [Acidimicrobiales bacterium]
MLTFVRHGRTVANRERRLLGRLDVDLDDLGRAQAGAVAAYVGPVDRVVCSPLRRTRQTAEAWGQDVEVDDRWLELDYGDLDGTPLADVDADVWAAWQGDVEFVPAGGESLAALGRRVQTACEELATAAIDDHVVVVTHVSPIKAAVAWALGVDDDVAWRMFVAPGSVTRIDVGERRRSLRAFNLLDHLDGLGS